MHAAIPIVARPHGRALAWDRRHTPLETGSWSEDDCDDEASYSSSEGCSSDHEHTDGRARSCLLLGPLLGGLLGAAALSAAGTAVWYGRWTTRGRGTRALQTAEDGEDKETQTIDPLSFYNESVSGDALYLGGSHGGSCGFKQWSPQGIDAVALNRGDLAGNQACGMCIRVESAKDLAGEPVTDLIGKTFVVNNGIEGSHGDVAFQRDVTKKGGVSVTWKATPCLYEAGIEYMLVNPSGYYVGARPINAIYPVRKMELKVNGIWEVGVLDPSGYSFSWRNDRGHFRFPLEVRLTPIIGGAIEDSIVFLSDKLQPGKGVQFASPVNVAHPRSMLSVRTHADEPVSATIRHRPLGATPWCSAPGEDCRLTGCCAAEGQRCFEKNAEWAQCKAQCTAGKNPNDPIAVRTPWSCNVIKKGQSCAQTHEDCHLSKCCVADGQRCYEKNAHYAACKKHCKPGEDPNDLLEFRTPWSCKLLLPEDGRKGAGSLENSSHVAADEDDAGRAPENMGF